MRCCSPYCHPGPRCAHLARGIRGPRCPPRCPLAATTRACARRVSASPRPRSPRPRSSVPRPPHPPAVCPRPPHPPAVCPRPPHPRHPLAGDHAHMRAALEEALGRVGVDKGAYEAVESWEGVEELYGRLVRPSPRQQVNDSLFDAFFLRQRMA